MNLHPLKVLPFLALATITQAQINVAGLTDQSKYTDQVTFTIENQAGHTYDARLDGQSVPVGTPVLVNAVDYHELSVFRTNDTTQAVSSQRVRFIIRNSVRGSTEDGIPPLTPCPLVNSASAEFAGAQLRLIVPQDYPAGMDIPVVAWMESVAGHAVRVNGTVAAPGQSGFQLFRGVGSGLLESTLTGGTLDYAPSVGGLTIHKTIDIKTNTVWTQVGGTLSGSIDWPAGSRIAITNHVVLDNGAALTIGAGTVVRINPGLDITNNAQVVINGTVERPVVFAPVSRDQPWGGFTMRSSAGSIVGTGVIFTGSGARPNWFGSDGNPGSHRREQSLFFCGGDNQITLTDAAAIYLAGQLGHAVNASDITLHHFLLQRATSGGEFTGANFVVNDSAFIEFPVESESFADGDNDALYIIEGTHGFTNTLFGWTKDDGVDSGGSGAGQLEFENCWFEGIFHEANSLSGVGKVVNHHHDVFINCGQALEAGYDNPRGLLDDCLVLHNLTGGRFGDNYGDGRSYTGFMRVTNSVLLHNHRDVWGLDLNDWIYHTERMDVRSNWLTGQDPLWPENQAWDPVEDAARLAAYLNTPASAPVGAGFLLRTMPAEETVLGDGVPLGLSCFSTNVVIVAYALEVPSQTLATGTLEFSPGKMIQRTPPLPAVPAGQDLARLRLSAVQNCEITGGDALWFIRSASSSNLSMIPLGADWRYFDSGQLPASDWADAAYDDTGWDHGPAQLGYGDGDEATTVSYGGSSSAKYITTYFRHAFTVADPGTIATLSFLLRRDDGAVVYLNGQELFRSNLPEGPVDSTTRAPLADDDGGTLWPTNVSAANLISGTNVLAVEIHQESPTSSDISFDLSLEGVPQSGPSSLHHVILQDELVLYWADPSLTIQAAEAPAGPWMNIDGNPGVLAIPMTGTARYFRLNRL